MTHVLSRERCVAALRCIVNDRSGPNTSMSPRNASLEVRTETTARALEGPSHGCSSPPRHDRRQSGATLSCRAGRAGLGTALRPSISEGIRLERRSSRDGSSARKGSAEGRAARRASIIAAEKRSEALVDMGGEKPPVET